MHDETRERAMKRSATTSSDGVRIVWTTFGDGPGVVIVPGSLTDGAAWHGVAERLSHRFSVHVISRRGMGASGDSPDYDIMREYEDVRAVLETTDSSRLIGHSFGAICALGAALSYENLERLILYEPPLNLDGLVIPPDALADIESAARRGDFEIAVDIGLRRCIRLPNALVDDLRTRPIWDDMVRHGKTWPREIRAIHEMEPGVDAYRAIEARTLLPVGARTAAHHRAAAQALLGVLPDAERIELPDAGHQAHLEITDRFASVLMEFLR